MMSWSNWTQLTRGNIGVILPCTKGVYAIRIRNSIKPEESDIIYIGCAGIRGNGRGVNERLTGLRRGLNKKVGGEKYHCAAPKIRKFRNKGLEFSWFEVFQAPDGIEKCLLCAFWISTGKPPACNDRF